jgi:nitroreductase
MNQTIETLLTRRSIRQYAREEITDETVRLMLASAMSAPSAANQKPWHFVVVRNQAALEQLATIHSGTRFVAGAALAIVVFANPAAATLPAYWRDDCAAATQNILLAAHALGFGGTWIGVGETDAGTIDMLRSLFHVPEEYLAFSVISLGKPAANPQAKDRYLADRVHSEQW